MNSFNQPLFDSVVLVLLPKPFHLVSIPFWYKFVVFYLLPERSLGQVVGVVLANDLEEFDALHDCECLLLANAQFFAVFSLVIDAQEVVFDLNHLVASDLSTQVLKVVDSFFDPSGFKNLAGIKLTQLHLRMFGFDLKGEALVGVDHDATILFDELLHLFLYVAALRNEKH